MPLTLLIARHGNTFNSTDIVRRVGSTDLPLTERGVAQGRELGLYLKHAHLTPNVIFTSQLKRTAQTAAAAQQAMHTQLPIHKLAIFNEIDYGPDEYQPETQVIERLGKAALNAWDNAAIVPDGWKVNPKTLIHNWFAFATELEKQYRDQIVLVVTSNGIARFAPHLTRDFASFTQRFDLKLSTGGLAVLQHQTLTSTWHCLHWNIQPASAPPIKRVDIDNERTIKDDSLLL